MTAVLTPSIIFQGLGFGGLPLPGGKLFSYVAGTSTPQATYTDSTQGTPNTNPVILNANGQAAVWLDPTLTYKFKLTDYFGNQIYVTDQVQGSLTATALSVILTQQFIGKFLYPQTAAELAATITPVNFSYPPGNVLRYGTNTSPGTTDMSAAFQSAFNQQSSGGAPIYVPSGVYIISSVISTTTAAPFYMYGDGMGKTRIAKHVDADCFVVTNSSSAFNQITIENLTISADAVMSSGSALNLTCTGIIPSVSLRNIQILCGGSFTFATAIKLNNCGETEMNRVIITGIDSTSMAGISITQTQQATVYRFFGCSIYNCSTGVGFINTTNPGIEGIEFYGCEIVNVQFGVVYTNSFGVSYSPPGFTWIGGHINSTNVNINLSEMSQVLIQGLLSYNSGSNEHFNFNIVGDVNIQGNIFVQVGGVADGIVIQSANGPINGGVIANNEFKLGVTGNGVTFVAANYINLLICNLVRSGGSNDVSVIGSPDASVHIYINPPQVTGWGTPVGGSAVNNYNITDAGGANSNTNKAVAEIITYLKARGDFGA